MSMIDPAQLQQLQQIQQAGQPVTAQTPQAPDPLAAQADALSKQIATMLIQQKPTFGQSLQQGIHQAGIAGLAQGTGGNAAQAVNADLERQQQGQQNAVQNRVQLLNQIRQQQNEVAQRGQEQQRIGIAQGQLDSQEKMRVASEEERRAKAKRDAEQADEPILKETPQGVFVFDKKGNLLRQYGEAAKPPAPPKVNYSNDGIPISITHGPNEYTIDDPNLPPDLKPLAQAAKSGHTQRLTEQANISDQLNARQEARAEAASKRAQAIKNSEAPDQTKNLVTAAYLTQDTLNDVRDLMKAYPDLVGPAIGRMEEAAQGAGTSFGLQSPEKEKAAANLAKNFADLVINEARTASPNRTPKEILDIVKSTSANLAKNPNMIEGFLNGADQGAQRAIRVGQQWGITPGGVPAATANQPKPTAGAQGQFKVTAGGKEYSFDTKAQLDEFKKRAGIPQ